MSHEVKVGDPVEFWFTDEQGSTRMLNGKVAFIEQQLDADYERPTVVCGTREVISLKQHLDIEEDERTYDSASVIVQHIKGAS